jgi:hypothetical protein
VSAQKMQQAVDGLWRFTGAVPRRRAGACPCRAGYRR